jgi:hypothetical protein
MADHPENGGELGEQRRFGPDLRLPIVLSEEFEKTVVTRGTSEWAEVDKWRFQRGKLMHELTHVGISGGRGFGSQPVVARPNDRADLCKILMDLVARNRFNPSSGLLLYHDLQVLERECDMELGEMFWRQREPFIAHWQDQYKPDRTRLELLKQVVEALKGEEEYQMPLHERAWQWVECYFQGGCPQEIEVPDNQDTQAVLQELERDFSLVRDLPLSDADRNEVLRVLSLDFIGGEYPISLQNSDTDSEEAMLREAEAISLAPQETQLSGGLDLRAIAIAMLFKRYRGYVAQGFDFGEEEEKRRAESQVQEAMHMQDHERRQQDFDVELAFLRSLDLPKFEAQEWIERLYRTANMPHFRVNRELCDPVHTHVRWLIANMPSADEYYQGDPWSVPSKLLSDHWSGHHHSDAVRWAIVEKECADLPAGLSKAPNGDFVSLFRIHEKFINGSTQSCAKLNASQDEIRLEEVHQADMNLIRGLGLSDDLVREAEWEYNAWLLDGKLPIVPDRETKQDRSELQARFTQLSRDGVIQEWGSMAATQILQIFCDHWHFIAKRPPSRDTDSQ